MVRKSFFSVYHASFLFSNTLSLAIRNSKSGNRNKTFRGKRGGFKIVFCGEVSKPFKLLVPDLCGNSIMQFLMPW